MSTTPSFHLTIPAQRILFGAGVIEQLDTAVAEAGWQRIMLCTTPGARARGQLAAIEDALGERLVATYERVQAHVPDTQVAEAVALATEHAIDAVIGFGGGSSIGTAKAVSAAIPSTQGESSRVAVIAIPTTYAGSEMTAVFGVTSREDGVARKVTQSDPLVTPRLVVYDPLLTLDLPPHVTAGTGINAVAHCIEALYSTTRNPFASAAAMGGLRAISHALLRCYASGDDLDARSELLSGAYLAGTALAQVSMGLHHGVCHVLGGTAGVAHGDANAIILPHAMRFKLSLVAPWLAEAAGAMGITPTGNAEAMAHSAAQQVATWVAQMGLPTRLREVGVAEEQLPHLAELAFASRTVRNDPRPIADVAEIEAFLLDAW